MSEQTEIPASETKPRKRGKGATAESIRATAEAPVSEAPGTREWRAAKLAHLRKAQAEAEAAIDGAEAMAALELAEALPEVLLPSPRRADGSERYRVPTTESGPLCVVESTQVVNLSQAVQRFATTRSVADLEALEACIGEVRKCETTTETIADSSVRRRVEAVRERANRGIVSEFVETAERRGIAREDPRVPVAKQVLEESA